MSTKRLIIRLSSLGDVILSSSALEAPECAHGVDWVVAREYAEVLRGHPKIRKLWEFDRTKGIKDWFQFCASLWDEQYDEVYDLHGTIRAQLLRAYFFLRGLGSKKSVSWSVASKQRFENYGFIIFKKCWPRRWLAQSQVSVFGKTLGGNGQERPHLKYLTFLRSDKISDDKLPEPYLCVMPGSNWPGKTWSGEKYFEVLKDIKIFPIVMGQSQDPESIKLLKLFKKNSIPHFDGVGKWTLQQVARVLSGAKVYLGSDTGLAHLSEAVGTDAIILYGPTAPGLGFEPWREGSRAGGADLWCRPCGKIGQYCFRPVRKFHCLKMLDVQSVRALLREKGYYE